VSAIFFKAKQIFLKGSPKLSLRSNALGSDPSIYLKSLILPLKKALFFALESIFSAQIEENLT
jgi:hypothetical protein